MNPELNPAPDQDAPDAPAADEIVEADAAQTDQSDAAGTDAAPKTYEELQAELDALKKRKGAGDRGAITAANKKAEEATAALREATEALKVYQNREAQAAQAQQKARLDNKIDSDLAAERQRMEDEGYDPASIERQLERQRRALTREAEADLAEYQATRVAWTNSRVVRLQQELQERIDDSGVEGLTLSRDDLIAAAGRLKRDVMDGPPGAAGMFAVEEVRQVARQYVNEMKKAANAAKANEGRKLNGAARSADPAENPDQMGDGGGSGLDYRTLMDRRANGQEPNFAEYRQKMLKSNAPVAFLRQLRFIR